MCIIKTPLRFLLYYVFIFGIFQESIWFGIFFSKFQICSQPESILYISSVLVEQVIPNIVWNLSKTYGFQAFPFRTHSPFRSSSGVESVQLLRKESKFWTFGVALAMEIRSSSGVRLVQYLERSQELEFFFFISLLYKNGHTNTSLFAFIITEKAGKLQ